MFPRWMNGTCLEAPPKLVPEQDEPVRFTFFSDVQLHPMVLELASTVQYNIQKGVTDVLRYLAGWKRKYKPLWRMQMVRGDGASHYKLCSWRGGSLGGGRWSGLEWACLATLGANALTQIVLYKAE